MLYYSGGHRVCRTTEFAEDLSRIAEFWQFLDGTIKFYEGRRLPGNDARNTEFFIKFNGFPEFSPVLLEKRLGRIFVFSGQQHLSTIQSRGIRAINDRNGGFYLNIP